MLKKTKMFTKPLTRALRYIPIKPFFVAIGTIFHTRFEKDWNFTNIEAAIRGKSSRKRFWKNSSQCGDILLEVEYVIASFRCYDNSDVVATLIITNFHLFLIQLWWQFFQISVYGDVLYAQTWVVLTLKNCIKPP